MIHRRLLSTHLFSSRLFIRNWCLLALCCWLSFVTAERRNITIDGTNTLITYYPASGSWGRVVGDRDANGMPLDASGGHMLTQNPNAYATLTYTYVSFWVMSTKWPYPVTTEYIIDGTNQTVIDLEDPNTPNIGGVGPASAASTIVASFIGSSSQQHDIGIYVAPGGRFAVLDRLIFEVEVGASSAPVSTTQSATQTSSVASSASTSQSSTVSASQSSTGPTSKPHSTHTLGIALGIALPLLSLFIFILVWWFIIRRRSSDQSSPYDTYPDESEKHIYNDGDGPGHGIAAPAPGVRHSLLDNTSTTAVGYGVPSNPYIHSHSSSSGIAGAGGLAYPQTQRPPYPEIADVPDSYNPYAEAGYVPPHAIEAANARRSRS
ncbi:hypothetical protein CPB83DRAFT_863259 [Crepidotus variabilis]|uniref:Mid2 domain-containing protein n=1 Tax=Crepidotus variabilis TaxID=179855 RepID=A0A9P6E664_9AGAR|nr:hypothetical protein CPB83DRAFT_863259 [Crepidotus variabilis]